MSAWRVIPDAEVVALAYHYPNPTSLEALTAAVETVSDARVRRPLVRFIDAVGSLDLGRWEELHTFTLDLSPLFIPYVGHVEWGENYRRGEFMADLKRDMERVGVDLGGELPDHMEPILRYLAITPDPLADLTDVLTRAVRSMAKTLDAAADDNPYRHVLSATLHVVEATAPATVVSIGGRS